MKPTIDYRVDDDEKLSFLSRESITGKARVAIEIDGFWFQMENWGMM